MISHTPNSILEKRVDQLNAELKIKIELITSMRLEINTLKKKRNKVDPKTTEQKKIDNLTDILHTQNALISELKKGVTKEQAKALNSSAVKKLTKKQGDLEAQLFSALEAIKKLKEKKSTAKIQEHVTSKKKASDLADLLANALDEASPSAPVKEYLERTLHTMRKTTDISVLRHFFIQAIEGFELRAQELKRRKKDS
jgi:hypothetical protein